MIRNHDCTASIAICFPAILVQKMLNDHLAENRADFSEHLSREYFISLYYIKLMRSRKILYKRTNKI